MAFIYPLNVCNRQNCTIVSILWMRLTVSLIVVDFYKHICEIFIPPMSMTQFSFTFQGKIDTSAIANSILQLLGENGCGKVEVVCTL